MSDLEVGFEKVFGFEMTDDIIDTLKKSITYRCGGKEAIITSMLSDVQELMLLGHDEDARKKINVVKYLVNTEL